MAASTIPPRIGNRRHSRRNLGENANPDVSRQEMQAAIAKSMELRALHASLIQGNYTADSPSPSSLAPRSAASNFSAQDYPVFTPCYEEDEPLPDYLQHKYELKSRTLSGSWDGFGIGPEHVDGAALGSKKDIFLKNPSSLQNSPAIDFYKPTRRRNSIRDLNSISSRNRFELAVIDSESETPLRSSKNSNILAPSSNPPSTRTRGDFLMRLFPKLKKKHKPEEISILIEALKKEMIEANEHRDAAVTEAADMKCSLEELRQKLEHLESYCEGLKTALRQVKDPHGNSTESFEQTVSESKLSVRQFCEIVAGVGALTDKLTLEAIVNQSLYRDFENRAFRDNGCHKFLDPEQDRRARCASFAALRGLSWNEVLSQGTKFYSEEFSKFCDQKMSCIVAALKWTRPWPEQLLQAFFVAAKCVWLVHLLAFSFDPPVSIFRVEENIRFDPKYMEDVVIDRQGRSNGPGSSRVKLMVMPGFYVRDGVVLRCKVRCKYNCKSQ